MTKFKKIGCVYDDTQKTIDAFNELKNFYDIIDLNKSVPENLDLIIVLGGDGFLLHNLHKYMDLNIPFFGMNCGNIGFLLNKYDNKKLLDRINNSQSTILHPLQMTVIDQQDNIHKALAINEVSLLRQSYQAAHIKIIINNEVMMEKLVSDGIMLSSPAGSSAYNLSAGGPILPLESNILALTPISPFRPRRWGGALLSQDSDVEFHIIDSKKRPVNSVADFIEFKDVKSVQIKQSQDHKITLLFDKNFSLEKRMLHEQFTF